MTHWRMKQMPLAEWAPFQECFGEIQMVLRGHPDLAMFCVSHAGQDLTDIYITGPELDLIERFSPGGWEDADKPSGPDVALLVGREDSWERLGVELPSVARRRETGAE